MPKYVSKESEISPNSPALITTTCKGALHEMLTDANLYEELQIFDRMLSKDATLLVTTR